MLLDIVEVGCELQFMIRIEIALLPQDSGHLLKQTRAWKNTVIDIPLHGWFKKITLTIIITIIIIIIITIITINQL